MIVHSALIVLGNDAILADNGAFYNGRFYPDYNTANSFVLDMEEPPFFKPGKFIWNGAEIQELDTHRFDRKKDQTLQEIKDETLKRVQKIFPAVSNFDELVLEKERWLSIAPAARNPTAKYQDMIDIVSAAITAYSTVKGYTTEAEVREFNVPVDPSWPGE
jgi:hypothetical protein